MKHQSPLTLASKNIKAELAQRFPAIAFSVRSRRYAGGDSISVVWAGDPSADQVAELTRKYEQGTFNGNTDSYEFDENPAASRVPSRAWIYQVRDASTEAKMITEVPTKESEPKQRDKYELYEQRKAQLPADLSPCEYETACKRIADELGV